MPDNPAVIVISRLPLSFETELVKFADGSWSLVANDVSKLRDALGERTLWAFARCFDAIDRMVSLTELLPRNEGPHTTRQVRNQWTAFILTTGLMREIGLAIADLGVKKRLSADGLTAWNRLAAIVKRWNAAPLKDARDNLAFHLDEKMLLFKAGFGELQRRNLPVPLVTGDKSTPIDCSFIFGRDILSLGLWPVEPGEETLGEAEVKRRREGRLADFITTLLSDQQTVQELVQVMLFEVLKTAVTRRSKSKSSEGRAS